MNTDNTILTVDNVHKRYRRRVILDGISFSVCQGDLIGIVGANGCGKSTLLRILSGVERPDSGIVKYSVNSPVLSRKLFSGYAGYVPQENPLFENLTVTDNLKFWYCETPAAIPEVLRKFGLSDYRNYIVSRLSGGMKKRLSIACSVAGNPPVLILDEPGASLDIVCKSDICSFLTDYRNAGGTVIITSHEECELALCTRMLMIKNASLCEIEPVSGHELMALIRNEAAHE